MHATTSPWLTEFNATYRDLLRFLRRRTGSDDTARDLAHDAWVRVAEHHAGVGDGGAARAGAPSSPGHARAYLFTVAERLAIDHLRRQRHWHDELAPRLHAVPGHTPDVAESHAYAQALRAVDGALAAMPARMREVFIAHRIDGAPHDELALRHGVSRKTIEREVTRAMDLAEQALLGDAAAGHSHAADTPRHGRRRALGALLGVAGFGGTSALAWQAWRAWVPQWQGVVATPAGRVEAFTLADGSRVTLGADSALSVRLFATRRETRLLHGAAFFDVAEDAARPFTVRAGQALVTVLGTRFAVEMGRGAVLVSVELGRVALASGGTAAPLLLGAGDAARVSDTGNLAGAAPHDPADIAPWRSGWLHFDALPLAEAAEQLNRYRPHSPVQVAASVAHLPVLARVDLARSGQWLHSLPGVLPVRVVPQPGGGVFIGPR